MQRRRFLKLLGSALFVPVVEPQIKYILPPVGGWNLNNGIYTVTPEISGEIIAYWEFLHKRGVFSNPDIDIMNIKKTYLDMRALSYVWGTKGE